MKIFVISNLYPPCHIGGYELGCCDITKKLRTRGHEVAVLTSDYKSENVDDERDVYRLLRASFGWDKKTSKNARHRRVDQIQHNLQVFESLIREFVPDIVYIWNFQGFDPSFLFRIQSYNIPVAYYVSGYWLAAVPKRLRYRGLCRAVFLRLWDIYFRRSALESVVEGLDLRHTQFTSQFVKQRTLDGSAPCQDGTVIHWGIDVERFPFKARTNKPIRLLYAGQVVPHKGVHTAIEALARVREQSGCESVELTIVGGTVNPDYETKLRRNIKSLGLDNKVHFTGVIRREQLRDVYAEHDILVFPSVWEEPFSITLLEAMSSGLAVVSTTTGGSSEILKPGVNSVTFEKENAFSCAAGISKLICDASLYSKITSAARRSIEDRFTVDIMVNQIEKSLQNAVNGKIIF